MPISDDVIRRRCEMFESYCKTVLRNYARDLERAERRREEHEILTDDPLRYHDLFGQRVVEIEIEIDEPFTIMCMDRPCVITEETLYNALLSLPKKQRTVVLCGNWFNMEDEQIAALFGVTERTIRNWRLRAAERIKLAYRNKDAD